jgi:hypothetical protein
MSERQKETDFLKTLIEHNDCEQCRHLRDRIKRAEKDEKCIRCAVYLVALLAMLSLSGLGYAAVLVPQFTRFSSHIATKIFCTFGLGSVICVPIFLGFWLRYRGTTNQIYDECRRFVRTLLESRVTPPSPILAVEREEPKVYQIETAKPRDETELLQQAS